MFTTIYDSPVGQIKLTEEGDRLTGLYYVKTPVKEKTVQAESALLKETRRQLDLYFRGNLKRFELPLNPVGTEFRERVWHVLMEIPYGTTVTYGEIAAAIGKPAAVRAVGGANHNNPISIIIPCHRVIGANGNLTGYGGGLEAKAFLLKLEKNNLV